MKLGFVRLLIGSFVVYLAMAACSASGSGPPGGRSNATTGGRGNGGSERGGTGNVGGEGIGGAQGTGGTAPEAGQPSGAGADGDPDDGGLLDVITDPVPDAMADSGSTSGSRLKARYWVGDDGSRWPLFGAWFDTERNENCAFGIASDGTYRCLPSAQGATSGSAFADAACAEEVAIATPPGNGCSPTPVRYVARSPEVLYCPTVGYRTTLYQAGSAVTATNYYLKSGSSCVSVALTAGQSLYRIGAEITASSFVRAVEEVEQ